MGLNIIFLPVVTKDLPISPRFSSRTNLYCGACSALVQLVNQWLNFTYSRCHAFRNGRKNTNPSLTRIELTASAPSRCAGYLLDCSAPGTLGETRKSNRSFDSLNPLLVDVSFELLPMLWKGYVLRSQRCSHLNTVYVSTYK